MAKDENKKNKNVKKENKKFFKNFKAELKKVVWPTPKELANNTAAVIAFVFIIALIVFICDFCLMLSLIGGSSTFYFGGDSI